MKGLQKIVYSKREPSGDRIISEVNAQRWFVTPENVQGYLRGIQPFTKPGNPMSIPLYEDGIYQQCLNTTRVQLVTREGTSLVVTTKNSTYVVDYKGVDLDKMLAEQVPVALRPGDEFPAVASQ